MTVATNTHDEPDALVPSAEILWLIRTGVVPATSEGIRGDETRGVDPAPFGPDEVSVRGTEGGLNSDNAVGGRGEASVARAEPAVVSGVRPKRGVGNVAPQ